MGEPAYDDEEPEFGAPMPAPDRLWRHPAEAGAEQAAANLAARRAGGRRWPELVMAFLAGAAVVSFAWLFADREPAPVDNIIMQEVSPSTVLAGDEPLGFDEWAIEVSASNRNAVLGLQLAGGVDHEMAQAILYRDDGHLLTSAHAIKGASTISAVLPDGRGLPALLVASDPVSGIAILKIASPELDPAIFSNGSVFARDRLVGIAGHTDAGGSAVQTVDVLGNGQVTTLPNGDLLSGLYRLSTELDATWAGAPIVDENGGVVAMAVPTSTGANYAIPTDEARRIANELIDSGSAETEAWLGIRHDPLTPRLQEQRGVRGGVLVTRVWSETPAARAGLAAGDVIIGIDEVNIVGQNDLEQAMGYASPGQQVEIRYVRRDVPDGPEATDNDAEYTVEGSSTIVTLGAQPRRSS